MYALFTSTDVKTQMIDLDLVLAYAHHTAIFLLISVMAAEWILLRPGLSGPRLVQLVRVDSAYGIVAGLVIASGLARVFLGHAGAGYYGANWVFWGKMGLFALAGILSVPATLAILRWNKARKTDAAFAPADTEVMPHRRLLYAQFAVTLAIPLFGLAMGRGYGMMG